MEVNPNSQQPTGSSSNVAPNALGNVQRPVSIYAIFVLQKP